jgi:hypothetical protein
MKIFDFKKFMRLQCEEIRRRKWIESEKVGYDLGKDAELDWIKKYAVQYRDFAKRCEVFYTEEK